jgi:hypothetical protein
LTETFVTFLIGGGYHNLSAVHSKPGNKTPDTGAVLKYAAAKSWGDPNRSRWQNLE